jgi:hypothetical protein
MPLGTYYADASYLNDNVFEVTVPTTGGGQATFTLPTIGDGTQTIKWRSLTITDITVATGGTANAKISVYFRIDGHTPIEANGGPDTQGLYARVLQQGASLTITRNIAGAITFLNGGANAQKLQIELGG